MVSIDLITGATARRQRREILDDLRVRRLDAVVAPRVLDEGIDVPDADLGIVMSASRTRRQMIQRMGRILRRKQPGVAARFVIMFAKDTLEDPTQRAERDGFLDEIERIADASGVFDGARFDALEAFLATPGPALVPAPERVERRPAQGLDEPDVVVAYAHLAFVPPADARTDHVAARAQELSRLEAHLPVSDPVAAPAPYLEVALAELPRVAAPKVPPRRLSTGQAPLEIARVESEWRIRCTGCGEASRLVQFRWQALEETVDCRCA
jgi:hypothetical protein